MSVARAGVLALALAVTTVPTFAAITRGANGGANNSTTAATTTASITNFTIDATSNPVLYCLTGSSEQTVTSPDPAVVWDSAGANQSMTKISASTGTGETSFLYRLIGPTPGSLKTISVSGLSSAARDAVTCVVYYGVDQVTPNDTIDLRELAVSQNPTSNSITSPAGDWILGFFARNGSTVPTVSGGGNVMVATQGTAGSTAILGMSEDADGADDTMDYASGGNSIWTLFTFNLNASGGAPAATCQGKLSLLGVGCHP